MDSSLSCEPVCWVIDFQMGLRQLYNLNKFQKIPGEHFQGHSGACNARFAPLLVLGQKVTNRAIFPFGFSCQHVNRYFFSGQASGILTPLQLELLVRRSGPAPIYTCMLQKSYQIIQELGNKVETFLMFFVSRIRIYNELS